jgi:exonuclease III
MTGKNRHLLILTLNINGLNAPIKSHRTGSWSKKQDPTICCLQETHLTEKKKRKKEKRKTTGLESKVGKKFSKKLDPAKKQE